MIERLIDYSAQHKYAVIAVVFLLSIAGWWCMLTTPLDVLPDLSDPQVIISTDWDRSPEVMEDQITYPIVNALQGTPRVKTVRAVSSFGSSLIYVIFTDGTDLDWARSRVGEKLASVAPRLPEGVKPSLGPAASGVNWIFQYALKDKTGQLGLAELRHAQDAILKPALQTVQGVAEIASVGGYQQQLQVNIDPERLLAYSLSIRDVVNAVRDGNQESSGRLLEFGGTEYMVRGRGYAHSLEDFKQIVVRNSPGSKALQISDLGEVVIGPEMRRGLADLNGQGEVVSGIVVARNGEDTLAVITRVKNRLADLARSLPPDMEIVPVYDRSILIRQSVTSLRSTLAGVLVTVFLIVGLFLLDYRSAVIPVLTIPITLLITFIPLRLLGMSANIMSLAGLAIASSELVNASIIVVEQTHRKVQQWQLGGQHGSSRQVVIEAVKSVAAPSFFALLIIAISFLPVFALEAQEGRMFKPFALAKTIAMIVAALLTLTLDPALRIVLLTKQQREPEKAPSGFLRKRLVLSNLETEDNHPLSRRLYLIYESVVLWSLRHRMLVLGSALALMMLTVPVYLHMNHEFMPDLYEGSLLYMPATMPGLPVEDARRLLIASDRVIAQFPEVARVLGKAGRADTSTDPAPLSMFESVIILKPQSEWRHVDTWYTGWAPQSLRQMLRHVTPDTISREDLVARMNQALALPGFNSVWIMPIRGRLDMLSTGIRTPLGIKVLGADADGVAVAATQVQAALRMVGGTKSVFTEHTSSGHYLDVQWNREQLARYGLRVADAQDFVQYAIGGENISEISNGHVRIPINVRFMRGYRSDPESIRKLVISCGGSCQVAIGQLAELKVNDGPDMIRDEDGQLAAYVFIDLEGRDPNSYMTEAKSRLDAVTLPPAVSLVWSGQYESMARVSHRLTFVLPATLLLIAILLLLSTRSWVKTCIVLMALPFSAIGAIWFVYLAHYSLSTAVLIGIVALMGVDAETGVFMLLYMDLAYEEAKARKRLFTRSDLHTVILQGAAKRMRPKMMMFATTCIGLLPVMWSNDLGSDLLKRIAAPMIGGVLSSVLLELLVYPVVYELWRGRWLPEGAATSSGKEGECNQRTKPQIENLSHSAMH